MDYKDRLELRGQITAEFRNKGITSATEKKRIAEEVVGYPSRFTRMNSEELQMVLDYLENMDSEKLKSNIIAWAYPISLEEGVKKTQLRNFTSAIPSGTNLLPISLEENHMETNSMIIGFINSDHYSNYEEVKELLFEVSKDFKKEKEENVYTLENGLQVVMICDCETVEESNT